MPEGFLRPVSDEDIDLLFEWRNRDEIRTNMYNHHKIPYDTHKDWFQSMLISEVNKYFIYEQFKTPLGLVSFNNIDSDNEHASWAFYSADLSIRGLGSNMERLALQYAFEKLKLNKLNCEVLDFNYSVVLFHQKHGFKIEGVKKQQYKRDGKFHDIYHLSIFKKDYLKLVKDNFKSTLEKNYDWEFELTETKIDQFANISGDFNPIHTDDNEARKYGFNGRIAHGAILISEISRVAASHYPGPGTIYLGQKIEYKSPAYPNETIFGKAKLISQVGRHCLVKYDFFTKESKLIASSYSDFLIEKEYANK